MRLIDADRMFQKVWDGSDDDFTVNDVLELIDEQPTVNPWHMVEEPPKEDGWYMLGFLSRWKNGSWWIPKFPDYWMTAGAPKEITNE